MQTESRAHKLFWFPEDQEKNHLAEPNRIKQKNLKYFFLECNKNHTMNKTLSRNHGDEL